jgi:hypothetical protein
MELLAYDPSITMNSTEHIQRRAKPVNRLMKWPLLCGLLGLALARPALAAADAYVIPNNGIVSYPGTESYPPVIDATNFINNGTFIINFTALSDVQLYETSDTLNYTNGGVMMANTGFNFDNQSSSTGARTMSASFTNSGLVSCGSVNNTNDPFGGFLGFSGYAQCLVNATNIANPGDVDVGIDGLMQFTGQTVDLSRSRLNVEDIDTFLNNFGTLDNVGAKVSGTGIFDLNTNFWDPSIDLGPTFADSAFFPIAPFYLDLTNSTAYFNQQGLGTSNVITRAVFIEDDSGPDVSYNVYFNTADIGFGSGSVTIEWVGSYQDAASGNTFNNYLYLNDDYVFGSSTNVALINGIPDNFTFTESSTRLPIGVAPAPAEFLDVFPSGSISNRYAFANAQLISTTESTNNIANGAITNLPGRIQISAANELDLSLAQITGPNYLSVQASNQFDGSAGASIQAPYADFNIGVTNGFLTVSNLMSPSIPNWGGNVQAWSTRWLAVDATGVTNDFRVLIVGSQLTPTILAQVQDLILHGTNTVISDSLNVMRTFTADAQNLTLTTNGLGGGATSLDGELNVESSGIFWASSLPNLRNLTNNGAIRFQNLAQFIGSSNIVTVTPAIPAVAATGTLSEVTGRTNVLAGNKVFIGADTYVFTGKITNTVVNQVKIAAKFDGTMSNLIAAINHAAGAGTNYSTNTTANAQVTAGLLSNQAFTITAIVAGSSGNTNSASLSPSTTNLVWSSSYLYLTGGVDDVAATTNITSTAAMPYNNFINHGLLSDQGSTISADNFENSGTVSNGVNSFTLSSLTTTLTNGAIVAGGDIFITANSLLASNVMLQAGRSLTLTVTNLLTDGVTNGAAGLTNGNFWSVQSTNGTGGNGLILPVKPALGDLLGTTISNYAAGPNKQIINTWAGQDRGVSVSGYTNNAAVGRLVLDALGTSSQFKFSGAGTNNALYVDELVFADQMTNGINNNFDFSANLSISPGMMIYFAQAVVENGGSIAKKIDDASRSGQNNGRLRWIPAYAGYFSSTNLVYPDGTTNTVNAALAASPYIDSDGDGTANATDPTPFFTSGEVNLKMTVTNVTPLTVMIQWDSIPSATNCVQYKTNLLGSWLTLTNFVSPALVPPAGGWPITNTVFDAVNPAQQRFYNVKVVPNLTQLYGP